MSTTLIKRMSCGCEFLEQLDTNGMTSLRVDICEQEHQTRLESTRAVLNEFAHIEKENAVLIKRLWDYEHQASDERIRDEK